MVYLPKQSKSTKKLAGVATLGLTVPSQHMYNTKGTEDLQEHILFCHGFEGHKQGATESKKHDHKHNTEATHVAVNNFGKRLGV